jgi:hypothetical protein
MGFVHLPDDICPCPHWGYMIKGRVRMLALLVAQAHLDAVALDHDRYLFARNRMHASPLAGVDLEA